MTPEDMTGDHKEYLGDGVYASFDGFYIWLTTERESGRIERIALDPPLLNALSGYASRLATARVTLPGERG
jgi:hypothetical protein